LHDGVVHVIGTIIRVNFTDGPRRVKTDLARNVHVVIAWVIFSRPKCHGLKKTTQSDLFDLAVMRETKKADRRDDDPGLRNPGVIHQGDQRITPETAAVGADEMTGPTPFLQNYVHSESPKKALTRRGIAGIDAMSMAAFDLDKNRPILRMDPQWMTHYGHPVIGTDKLGAVVVDDALRQSLARNITTSKHLRVGKRVEGGSRPEETKGLFDAEMPAFRYFHGDSPDGCPHAAGWRWTKGMRGG
jgi:hypothetical protein